MTHARLLIADSHSTMVKAVRGLLADLFDTVVAVSSKDSLFENAAALKPDLIIVDLSLPYRLPGTSSACSEHSVRHRPAKSSS